ncbi:hypothetical protein S7711_04566 [Stachybotrys chartarum IBT 7711]|uniref:Proteophosphoglycan 5 n=1 Tax=Stachybotrys chartarum (strain CBS 109288 / IBT 7711) TaxID=1280523 RepID=A0A084APT5_STACB|nr:hypothetical protein S7711_04566 [Stachybotrys chartarum IBT 7711]
MADASVHAAATTTPSRRRRPRGNGKPTGQKAYASENDVGVVDGSRHSGTPHTPQKTIAASPPPSHSQNIQTGSKQKNRNKPKSKNLAASPEFPRVERQTPPLQRSSSAKAGSAAAFAGATFHASPAPSALPIPSFLARPSSDSPLARDAGGILQEPSPPATDTEVPTPHRPNSDPRRHESPLEFMFRAHREEKDRQQHAASSPGQKSRVADPASPFMRSPFETKSPSKPWTPADQSYLSAGQQQNHPHPVELDGTPGRALGPAFSTPYQERIKAAQASSYGQRTSNTTPPTQDQQNHASEDPTEALKKFLFSGNGGFGTNSAQSSAPPPSRSSDIQSSPSTKRLQSQSQPRHNNIQAMENDLRRILKLDLTTEATPAGSSFYPQ